MQAFYFMKTLHLQVVENKVVTLYSEQKELFEKLTESSDSNPLFVERFRREIISFFNKQDIKYTIHRKERFPYTLGDVRQCLDDYKNGRYVTNFEFINEMEKIINNKEI